MLRLGIYFHVFFGMFFLFLFPPMGILFLLVAFVLALIIIGTRKADILDNWSVLVRNGHGHRDKVISHTKEGVAESKAPSIEMKEEKVDPSLALASFGEIRDFLIVANRRNAKLSNFKVFVNANDYGKHLSLAISSIPTRTSAPLFISLATALSTSSVNKA